MKPFHWFLLVFLSMLWGHLFFLPNMALESFSPFSFAFLRISLAALLAAWWLKSRGVWTILGERWRVYLPMAVFHSALPFSFFAWGNNTLTAACRRDEFRHPVIHSPVGVAGKTGVTENAKKHRHYYRLWRRYCPVATVPP